MTQLSKSAFQALYGSSGTTFPDNTTGEISEADMRNFGRDIADSYVNKTTDFLTGLSGVAPGINNISGLKLILTAGASTSSYPTVIFRDVDNSNVLRVYVLYAGTDAESSPNVIRPNDYAGTSNEKVWKLADIPSGGGGTVESVSGDGVDNTDPDNPVLTFPDASEVDFTPGGNISATTVQAALQELDTEKQAALGFTPENTINKATDLTSPDNTKYPTTQAVATAISSAVTGLWDDRGNYDASGNVFPSSGGSGTAGAILKGDVWTISVSGTLGVTPVSPGDTVRALVDTPGSTSGNWAINAASSGSTTPNASQTVAGKVEIATTAEAKSGTTTGGSGADLVVRTDVLREKLRANRTVTGSSAIAQDDSEGLIYFNSASAFNFTIDQLVVDSYATFININSGTVTLLPGTGVTISGPTSVGEGESAIILYRSATNPIVRITNQKRVFGIAVTDESTPIVSGVGKATFRMPFGMTVTSVRASLKTAQTSGSIFTVDINEGGSSILSTKLTIDNTEKTSTTAATPSVISDATLADDAEITIDVDQIGDGTAVGLKIWLIGL